MVRRRVRVSYLDNLTNASKGVRGKLRAISCWQSFRRHVIEETMLGECYGYIACRYTSPHNDQCELTDTVQDDKDEDVFYLDFRKRS